MACKIVVKRGLLTFRIYWHNRQTEVTTAWPDTPKNRIKAEGRAQEISEQIKARTFDYLKWFPHGVLAAQFQPVPVLPSPGKSKTIRQYYGQWVEGKQVPFVRKGQARDYRQHFNCYILDFLGDRHLKSIEGRAGVKALEEFRAHLIRNYRISMKTARNVIDASFRAMIRDAETEGLIERNPFGGLPPKWWPKAKRQKIDPFTEKERDQILSYYSENRPYWAYAFVHFRFWTGTRPSEGTALKLGCVDLKTAKAEILESRYLQAEDNTKTSASSRTIELLPNVVDVLEKIWPLRAEPDGYMFRDSKARPIDQSEFSRDFQTVLRVLKIRPRPFKNLRQSYISLNLTIGSNPKWICEQVGTSMDMLQRNYGKYFRDDGADRLKAYISSRLAQKPDRKPDRVTKRKVSS